MSDLANETDLAGRGAARVEWIRSRMPLLARVRQEFAASRPFAGHRIGMSLHIEPKTAVLLETLAAGGAEIVATGNHGSTQDDVVAFLRRLSDPGSAVAPCTRLGVKRYAPTASVAYPAVRYIRNGRA